MWVAGSGSDRCGVGACQKIAELREVASEECPTGITLRRVKVLRTDRPDKCLVNGAELNCAGSHHLTTRLCACEVK